MKPTISINVMWRYSQGDGEVIKLLVLNVFRIDVKMQLNVLLPYHHNLEEVNNLKIFWTSNSQNEF